MGSSPSSFAGFTEEMLEEYTTLTYLNRSEILNLFNLFIRLSPDEVKQDFNHRIPVGLVESAFPQLKCNPFKDRIFKVFSSRGDDSFSFEDVLDLCSAMSEKCPVNVKASWAFRIYDFDEDGAIGEEDIINVIDRLTAGEKHDRLIIEELKSKVAGIILNEMDLEGSGSICQMEFEHALGKMSEFPHSFSFKL